MQTTGSSRGDRSGHRHGGRDAGAAATVSIVLMTPMLVFICLAAFQAALWNHARAEGNWAVNPVSSLAVSMDLVPAEAVSAKAALAAMPPLIKGYLRLGGKFSGSAVIDPQFGTTDVLVILRTEDIAERYLNYYGADAQRFA